VCNEKQTERHKELLTGNSFCVTLSSSLDQWYSLGSLQVALIELSCGTRTNYIIIYYNSALYVPYEEIRFAALKNFTGLIFASLLISGEYDYFRHRKLIVTVSAIVIVFV
jgi:hypothetical protein